MNEGERWQEAYDLQLRLLRAAEQRRIITVLGQTDFRSQPPHEQDALVFRAVPDALRAASPVFVSRNVFDLWEASWAEFEPEEFRASDPFVDSGFALLPASTPAGPVRAFVWAPYHDGYGHGVFTFEEETRLREDGDDELLAELDSQIEGAGFYPWLITGFSVMPWGDTDDRATARMWQAFWRLGREFVRGKERITRASRREGHRAGLEHEHVTVLRLRRTASKPRPDEPQPVDWRCQWVVRGHWRNQWYPSEQRHKQRYIAAHVKGPEDKPLRVTERVVEFVR